MVCFYYSYRDIIWRAASCKHFNTMGSDFHVFRHPGTVLRQLQRLGPAGYRESLRHTIELSEQLRAGLSQEQKELFEAYCENANAGHALLLDALHAPRPG